MARRGENIYLRKDGRYEGRYVKGKRHDGAVVYGSVYSKRYGNCKEKLLEMKKMYSAENLVFSSYGDGTMADFLSYWLNNIACPKVKDSTFANYEVIIDKRLIPALGKIKLIKLTKEEVQKYINTLMMEHLSPGSVRNIYRVLSSAMKKAKEYGYVQLNPCEGIELPAMKKKEAAALSITEQKKLEQACAQDKNGLQVLLAIYTGLRVGELCALKWCDIDFEKGLLSVSKTRQRVKSFDTAASAKTKVVSGSAKSQSSIRTIPLPSHILRELESAMQHSNGEHVFMYKKHPLEPRVLQYRFKRLLEKAGLRNVNFHSLRHSFATRCIELNFDIKTLSELLGHASAKLTLDRYGHSKIEQKRAAMLLLEKFYTKSA